MKIKVYNFKKQFALSRKQIEIILSVIPKEYFEPVKEFHITHDSMGQERFEFNYEKKIAYFEYPVEQKNDDVTKDAIKHLLIGLIRIKEKVKFGNFIPKNELNYYLEFSDKWLSICFEKVKNSK